MHLANPIRIMLVTSAVVACASTVNAQRSIRNSALFGPSSALELLARPDVRKELELVAEQNAKLRELRGQFRRLLRERFAELRSSGAVDARERAREIMSSLSRKLHEDISQILLPHQFRRLEQVQLQWQLGDVETLASLPPEVAKRLAITDDQRQQLLDKQATLTAEYRRQLHEIRVKARQQVMELLTPTQGQQLAELLGAPFQFDESPTSERRQQP